MVYGESNSTKNQTAPHRAGSGLDSPLSPTGARGGEEVRTMAKHWDTLVVEIKTRRLADADYAVDVDRFYLEVRLAVEKVAAKAGIPLPEVTVRGESN